MPRRFKFIGRLGGPQCVAAHTAALSQLMHSQLCALQHTNGRPMVVLYGRPHLKTWGEGDVFVGELV